MTDVIQKEKLERRLLEIFPTHQLFPSETNIPAKFTVFPEEPEQIKELVKLSKRNHITLIAVGGGSRLYKSDNGVDVAVKFSNLYKNIDHSPNDLVATVPAGDSFIKIQDILKEHSQTIPLNPPATTSSTIGGIVSSNAFGPHCHRFGTARDWVIATSLINDQGNIIKAGARVVKNVSGYDLNKLYIGSRGTLGFLLDISFQLYPVPEKRETLQAQFSSLTEALEVAETIRKTSLQVDSLLLVNGIWNPGKKTNWTLVWELSGSSKSLDKQRQSLSSLIEKRDLLSHDLSKPELKNIWTTINGKPGSLNIPDSYLLRISLGKKTVCQFIQSKQSELIHPVSIKIYPGFGTCFINIPESLKQHKAVIDNLIKEVKSSGGFIEFEMLPPKSNFKRWPILPSSFPWMKKIKNSFDPDGIFAPGFYVGGI